MGEPSSSNAAAIALPRGRRLYPSWVAGLGLASCLFLAFWVEPRVWLVGLGVLAVGLLWFRGPPVPVVGSVR